MARPSIFLFNAALARLSHLNTFNIVEIGSIRYLDKAESEGHSTLVWDKTGKPTWSVDVDPKATDLTSSILKPKTRVTCITADGIDFLTKFEKPITLLYLDGPYHDDGAASRSDVDFCRKWAADALVAALPKLSPACVVLLDDTDLPNLAEYRISGIIRVRTECHPAGIDVITELRG